MSWITIIWSMIASACLTLAVIYFLVWCNSRSAWAHLLFTMTATATAGLAFCELWMMRANTVGALNTALRVGQLTLLVLLISITWFVWTYLGTGRTWLAGIISVLRVLYVLPNFVSGLNPNYPNVANLRRIQFLGETATVARAVPNPFQLIGQFSSLLIIVFVADASVTAWRRGDRRKALVVGGGVEFFIVVGLLTSLLVVWSNVQLPIVISVCYLALVAVMGYELSRDVIRSARLVQQLQESDARARRDLANIAALERRSAMGQLSGSIAHELAQPLGAILRNAEAGLMMMTSKQPPAFVEIAEIFDDIREDDKRATAVIQRMRALLQNRELEERAVDVNQVARDVVALLGPDAAGRRVRVDLNLAAHPTVVNGDAVHLQQVFLNLILNAIDATMAGPDERRRVSVSTRSIDGQVEVAIEDAGPGIAVDLASIFEPFVTTKADGMGMGLSIARSIVEAHGGRLTAENNSGHGATFRFSVPLTPTRV